MITHRPHIVTLQGQQQLMVGEEPGHSPRAHLHAVTHQDEE